MQYTWRIAVKDDFPSIYELMCGTPLWKEWGIEGIKRRVTDPLNIGHLIMFHDKAEKLRGFVTLAHMSEQSENHQHTVGILPGDWQSGDRLWVVDLVAPQGGCFHMLRIITRAMNKDVSKIARFFRKKYEQVRRVCVCPVAA